MSSALVMVRQHLSEVNKRGDGLEDGRTRRERGELGRRGGEARRVARYSCVQLTTVYPALIELTLALLDRRRDHLCRTNRHSQSRRSSLPSLPIPR